MGTNLKIIIFILLLENQDVRVKTIGENIKKKLKFIFFPDIDN